MMMMMLMMMMTDDWWLMMMVDISNQIKSNQIYFSVAGKTTHNKKYTYKNMTFRYW